MPEAPASSKTRRTIRPPTAMCGQLRWTGPIRIWVISCCCAKPTMARAGSLLYLVPAGAEIGCQCSQPVDRLAIPGQAGVVDNDVDHLESGLVPECDARRAPQHCVSTWRGDDGCHDALGGLPQDLRLLPEVPEELFI